MYAVGRTFASGGRCGFCRISIASSAKSSPYVRNISSATSIERSRWAHLYPLCERNPTSEGVAGYGVFS